jgi:Arc/MetJ-type ribon-helix-helix transcriptional regulator
MTIELNPQQERMLRQAMRRRPFRSVDEALDAALSLINAPAVDPASPVPSPQARMDAVARIRDLRKGNRLPDGMTIRAMIDEGRA